MKKGEGREEGERKGMGGTAPLRKFLDGSAFDWCYVSASDTQEHGDKHAVSVAVFVQHDRTKKCEHVFVNVPRNRRVGWASTTGRVYTVAQKSKPLSRIITKSY